MSTLVGGMCMCSICCLMSLELAFLHLYSIFKLQIVFVQFVLGFFNVVLKRQTDICFTFVYIMCMLCIVFNLREI